MKVLMVAAGGMTGALCRYGVNVLSVRWFGDGFPWGTLCVNLVGCFLIGVFFALGSERGILSPSARLFLMTGFLGALTTFSAYALESVSFARGGATTVVIANVVANNVGGLILALLGMLVGRNV